MIHASNVYVPKITRQWGPIDAGYDTFTLRKCIMRAWCTFARTGLWCGVGLLALLLAWFHPISAWDSLAAELTRLCPHPVICTLTVDRHPITSLICNNAVYPIGTTIYHRLQWYWPDCILVVPGSWLYHLYPWILIILQGLVGYMSVTKTIS